MFGNRLPSNEGLTYSTSVQQAFSLNYLQLVNKCKFFLMQSPSCKQFLVLIKVNILASSGVKNVFMSCFYVLLVMNDTLNSEQKYEKSPIFKKKFWLESKLLPFLLEGSCRTEFRQMEQMHYCAALKSCCQFCCFYSLKS